MKKIFLYFLLFAAIVLTLSCEKESTTSSSDSNSNGIELRINPDYMGDSMDVFITETMQNDPEYSEYEAQDGLLIMEAALNYHTATPGEHYDESEVYEVSYTTTLKKVSGEFKFYSDTLEALWNSVLLRAQDAVNQVQFDNPDDPFNVIVDMEWTSIDLQSSQSTIRATFSLVVEVGNNSLGSSFNCEYGANDFWYAMNLVGTQFGCSTNTSTTSWAVKEIQRRLSFVCRAIEPCSYYAYITKRTLLPQNYASSSACSGEPPMYIGYNYNDCLTPYQMQCYTDGAINMSEDVSPYPTDPNSNPLDILTYRIFEEICTCIPTEYFHKEDVRYGKCEIYDQH